MLGSTITAAGAPSASVEVLVNGNRKTEVSQRSDKAASLLHPCRSFGGCLLDTNYVATTPPQLQPALHDRRGISDLSLTPLLLNTASAARSRRWEGNSGSTQRHNRTHRAASDLVLKVAVMEEVHGVDVSWLHHPNKRMRKVSMEGNGNIY